LPNKKEELRKRKRGTPKRRPKRKGGTPVNLTREQSRGGGSERSLFGCNGGSGNGRLKEKRARGREESKSNSISRKRQEETV